jgi:protein phosphatase
MSIVTTENIVQPDTQPPGPQQPGGSLAYHSVTHPGLVRPLNEDAYCVEEAVSGGAPSRYLLAVADGLGGHDSGEVASRMALEAVTSEFRIWSGGARERFVAHAVRRANDEVFAATHLKPEWHDMQTTLTAVALEGDVLVWCI